MRTNDYDVFLNSFTNLLTYTENLLHYKESIIIHILNREDKAYSSKNRICNLNKVLDSYLAVVGNYTEKVFVIIIFSL